GSAVTVDVNVDVPIDVTDVEQHFKEVGCDIPLSLQQLLARLLRSFWGDLGSTLWGDLGSTLWVNLGSTLWVNLSVLWVNLSVEVCGAGRLGVISSTGLVVGLVIDWVDQFGGFRRGSGRSRLGRAGERVDRS